MEMIITNLEAQEFLKDFEIRSETCILEEGKEKSELETVAEARGMKIKGSRDLAVFKTIYAFTDKANSNGAILPKKDLLRVLPQIIGKPVNVNHNRRFVVGHYIDYKYKQKDNKVIAYGVFYKSNFGDEWTRAKELLRKKKLSSSFEIWSPDDKKEIVGKGKYKMHFMEIAGGALIYEDKNNIPAFKNAKVLEMARKEIPELVYASKYNEKEIITSDKDYFRDSVEENLRKLNEEKHKKVEEPKKEEIKPKEEKVEAPKIEDKKLPKIEEKKVEKPKEVKKEEIKAEPKVEEPKEEVKVEINKLKCSNCGHEWEIGSQKEYAMGSEQCLKCKAILKQDGTMIYPPQIIDFKVSCPSCRMGNWLIMERSDKEVKVGCSCKKEYILTFAEKKDTEMIDKMNFPYSGSANCSQCGKQNDYEGISGITSRNIKCKKCGLEFPINIDKAKEYKKISKIEEVEIKKIEKTSEKGGNDKVESKPDKKKEVEKPKEVKKEEIKVEKKLEEKKEEVKVEEKKEEIDVDEKKPDETSKAKVEEPKVKEAPKTEAKKISDIDKTSIKNAVPADIDLQGNELVESMRDKIEEKVEESKEKVDKYAKSKVLRKAVSKIKDSKKELITVNKRIEVGKKGIKKLVSKVISLKKEIAKIKDEMSKKIKFYKKNAVEINKRRAELGDFGNDLTDEQILNPDKFEKAQLKKQNVELTSDIETSSDIVGLKKKDNGYYAKKQKEINDVAFPKKDTK